MFSPLGARLASAKVVRVAAPLPKAQRPRELPAGLHSQTPGKLHLHVLGLTAEDVAAILRDPPDASLGSQQRVTWAWPTQDG
ncbi:MAG: hypothetical protein ACTHPS_21505 [Streptosporangiaceae bacterium]